MTEDQVPIIVALSLHLASSCEKVLAFVPDGCSFPRLHDGYSVTRILLQGMASLQGPTHCDQCFRVMETGTAVLGKNVSSEKDGLLNTFFSPTCIGCFEKDLGGYRSTALAALVMQV